MKSNPRTDYGLLILRLGIGLIFLYAGSMKMFPVFGGKGYVATVDSFIKMGIPPIFAHLAIVAEFFGGLGVLFGFITSIASLGLLCTMCVATWLNAKDGQLKLMLTAGESFDGSHIMFPFFLALASLALLVTGPGRFSLDGKYFRRGGRR